MNKILILIAFTLLSLQSMKAQYGFGTNTPDPNAVMHLSSLDSTKGIIMPVVTTAKRPAASSNLTGMLIYNLDDSCFQVCDGASWDCITVTSNTLLPDSAEWVIGSLVGDGDTVIYARRAKQDSAKNIRVYSNGDLDIGRHYRKGGFIILTNEPNNQPATLNNLAIGEGSQRLSTSASYENTSLGYQTMYANDSGFRNTAIGFQTLFRNTNGSGNTALGRASLFNNTTGGANTALGINSLLSNTTGNWNVGIGGTSLSSNTTGGSNTAVGTFALASNTTGSANVSLGVESMYLTTTGALNVSIGGSSMRRNVSGNTNVAVGYASLGNNTTGNGNVAIGYYALSELNVTDGSQANNTVIGFNTGRDLKTGKNNTIIGGNVYGLDSTLNNNIILADGIGNKRLRIDSIGNVGLDIQFPTTRLDVNGETRIRLINDTNDIAGILTANDSGVLMNIPYDTLLAKINDSALWISGDQIGLPAGNMYARKAFELGDTVVIRTSTGFQNGFLGLGEPVPQQRLHVNGNAIIGGNDGFRLTVQNAAGSRRAEISANIASTDYYEPSGTWYINRVSTDNLRMNRAGGSVAIGITNGGYPGRLTVQGLTDDATANAFVVVDSNNAPLNELMVVRNDGNVGIGTPNPQSLLHLSSNTTKLTIQDDDATVGVDGHNNSISFTDQNNDRTGKIGFGTSTQVMFIQNENDNGSIWFSTDTISGTSTDIDMAINNIGNVGIGTTTPSEKLEVVGNIHASGVITSSDERYKKDIKTLDNTLNNLMKIRGVSYLMKEEFKDKGFGEGLQIGVIAQEVEKVYPELVTTNEDTGYKAVNYSKFTPILIEALKEEHNQTVELQKRIEELEKANNNLKTENAEQKQAFESLKAEVEQIKLLLNKQDLGHK